MTPYTVDPFHNDCPPMTLPISDSGHLRDYPPIHLDSTHKRDLRLTRILSSRDPNDGAHYRHMTTSSHQATMAGLLPPVL